MRLYSVQRRQVQHGKCQIEHQYNALLFSTLVRAVFLNFPVAVLPQKNFKRDGEVLLLVMPLCSCRKLYRVSKEFGVWQASVPSWISMSSVHGEDVPDFTGVEVAGSVHAYTGERTM